MNDHIRSLLLSPQPLLLLHQQLPTQRSNHFLGVILRLHLGEYLMQFLIDHFNIGVDGVLLQLFILQLRSVEFLVQLHELLFFLIDHMLFLLQLSHCHFQLCCH